MTSNCLKKFDTIRSLVYHCIDDKHIPMSYYCAKCKVNKKSLSDLFEHCI